MDPHQGGSSSEDSVVTATGVTPIIIQTTSLKNEQPGTSSQGEQGEQADKVPDEITGGPRRKSYIDSGGPVRIELPKGVNLNQGRRYSNFEDGEDGADAKVGKPQSLPFDRSRLSLDRVVSVTVKEVSRDSEGKRRMVGNRVEKWFKGCCNKDSLANLFFDYFLPASQLIAIGQPFIHPKPGAYLSQFSIIGYILIAIIFLVLGLKLKTDDIKEAVKSSHVFIIAIISGLFISGSIVAGITSGIPFDPYGGNGTKVEKISMYGPFEFKIGCLLYYSVPCSITAGIVLVAQADGNLPMAGAIATVANVIGCYTTPIMLKLYTASMPVGDLQFDVKPILVKLTISILCPVILGKILQCIPGVPKTVQRFKRWISIVTSLCLAIMLWMKVAKACDEDAFDGVKWQSLLFLIGFVLMMCVINISVNIFFSILLCMKHPFIRVMVLMVSQKTLVMAVTLVQVLPEAIGSVGLILVPCFVAHPTQIMVFSIIAAQMKKYDFDFDCPKGMPAKLVNLCDWMNGNKRDKSGDVVLSNPTHDAANGDVIDLGMRSRRRSSLMTGDVDEGDLKYNKERRRSSIKIAIDAMNGTLPGEQQERLERAARRASLKNVEI